MRCFISVVTLDGEILYHQRGKLVSSHVNASTFVNLPAALRAVKKKYTPQLGITLKSWTVAEIS